jgi:hypothetical protein
MFKFVGIRRQARYDSDVMESSSYIQLTTIDALLLVQFPIRSLALTIAIGNRFAVGTYAKTLF